MNTFFTMCVAVVLSFILCFLAIAEGNLLTGSSGDEVIAVQERLIALGYLSGKADGNFGKQTEKAVKSFQYLNYLEKTGVVDSTTKNLLMSDNAQPYIKGTPIPTIAPTPAPTPTPKPILDSDIMGIPSDWIMSDSGDLEIKLVDMDLSSYPTCELSVQFRIDQEKESAIFLSTQNLAEFIDSALMSYPELSNRKLKIEILKDSIKLYRDTGTYYTLSQDFAIQRKFIATKYAQIDIASVFPDDFVNYDVIRANAAFSECTHKYNITTADIGTVNAYDSADKKRIIFCFTVLQTNLVNLPKYIYAFYNTESGMIDIAQSDYEYGVSAYQNYLGAKSWFWVSKSTPLSYSSVGEALKLIVFDSGRRISLDSSK